MNKDSIINEYREGIKEKSPLRQLQDGGLVVGEEVDDLNRLQYVIERNGITTIEPANSHRNSLSLFVPKPEHVEIAFKDKIALPKP